MPEPVRRVLTIVPERSRARVIARAPGHSFTAEGPGVTGTIELDGDRVVALEARFGLDALRAGDPIGQSQLARFLELDQRPVAVARLTTERVVLLERRGETLRGKGPIELSIGPRTAALTLEVEGTERQARGRFELRFTALGYVPPRLLILKVKDELTVEVDLALVPASPRVSAE